MSEFLKMDIFFVVATLATVVLCVLVAIALVYGIRLLKTLNSIAEHVEAEAQAIRADIHEARQSVKESASKFMSLVSMFTGHKKRTRKKKESS